MTRDWESVFGGWAAAPSKTEQERSENAITAIRKAIALSDKLKSRGIRVFVQGSYRNRVNVRRESDVDVGVMLHDYFLTEYPAGKTSADFGNVDVDYTFARFKNELEEALVAHFGRAAVRRGNKAFDIKENSYHVEADVIPLFEFRQYWESGRCRCGVALIPDKGGRIENYPERLLESWPRTPQHYENGVTKNQATSKAFKGVVRILKSLRNEMDGADIAAAKPIPGFLVECLAWNTPNSCFSHTTWREDVEAVLYHLWSNIKTAENWTEVNDIKYLFYASQPWTRDQAYTFVNNAWDYVGLPRS